VGASLEAAGAAYFLGGSVASSLQGDPRSTNDIDIVTDLVPSKVELFAVSLGSDFECDEESLKEALRRHSSWNLYFNPVFTKIDLFGKGMSPFDDSEFARRRKVTPIPGVSLFIKSPEDTVLRKLLWHRAGGGLSDRQWRDVSQVLRVSMSQLDFGYLEKWSRDLGIEEAFARALSDSTRAPKE
jgi:hypothetical protein